MNIFIFLGIVVVILKTILKYSFDISSGDTNYINKMLRLMRFLDFFGIGLLLLGVLVWLLL
mgnify:CR=1 FL=1